ncbi:MAG: hypothetical protein M1117_02145 [Candidatus Thermoplasmatota archaeon]|nr:hypothetical protein [Candidatus Thermoplasmatota archaeon]
MRSFELRDGSSIIGFSIDLSRFSNIKDISHIAALTATLNLSYETVEERHVVIVHSAYGNGFCAKCNSVSRRIHMRPCIYNLPLP